VYGCPFTVHAQLQRKAARGKSSRRFDRQP
jgi:hypothetical protein